MNCSGKDEAERSQAELKVVGVGGAGLNAINAMIEGGVRGVEFIGVSMTTARIRKSKAATNICLGGDIRFGTGGNPEVARRAVQESRDWFLEQFRDTDLIFLAAGMGSGTGTGATPAIATIAKEAGALVIGIVTKPFMFEGKQRMITAEAGIKELNRIADCLILIPNDRLVVAGKGASLVDAFKPADTILKQAVQGIAELIGECGYINADFNDLKTVVSLKGKTMIGMGVASGENRAVEAVAQAIGSPLVEDNDIQGAKGILINITGSSNLTMDEFDKINRIVHEKADDDAVIIVGMVLDEGMGDNLKVTVIATGLAEGRGRASIRLV